MKSPILTISLALVAASNTFAAEDEAAELAKQLNNPVAALISVPFQANQDYNIGPAGGNKFTLNIQPVIPISISTEWNLILRTIVPVISQTDVRGNSGTQSGLGDITQSFFFSPKKPGPGGLIWGVGPVGLYPSATDNALGSDQWGLGPTFVVLKQSGGWTTGMLANQIWSLGGGDEPIYAAFIQPFVSYTTKTHTSITLNTESTYNWENNQWTVPINLMVSQVFKIGSQPMSLQLGARYYADGPEGHANWGARLNLTFLFPQKHAAPMPVSGK